MASGTVPNLGVGYIVERGTSNEWDYEKYDDNHVVARRVISTTQTHYTTVNSFYGYSVANIATPFTMSGNYCVFCTWSIGSGFSIPAGLLSVTTTQFNAYALSTQAGSTAQTVKLYMLLIGNV